MAAPIRTPRSAWIEAGLRALADGGPDAVRIEPLARTLGVTRGGFYWHFEHRQALLDALLDEWEQRLVDEVIDRAEKAGEDARRRLRQLSTIGFAGDELQQIDLAIRDWARRNRAVAARLRAVDNRRMDYLRAQFRELCDDEADVEARCMLAFSLWIANHFIAAEHPGRNRDEVLQLALRRLGR
jgi:AcrR family transcriptional regulator